jgi:hypothetical protein
MPATIPWVGGVTSIVGIKVGPVTSLMEAAQYWINVNGGLAKTPSEQRIISDNKDKITVNNDSFLHKNEYACRSLQDKWRRAHLACLGSSITLYPFSRKGKQSKAEN